MALFHSGVRLFYYLHICFSYCDMLKCLWKIFISVHEAAPPVNTFLTQIFPAILRIQASNVFQIFKGLPQTFIATFIFPA